MTDIKYDFDMIKHIPTIIQLKKKQNDKNKEAILEKRSQILYTSDTVIEFTNNGAWVHSEKINTDRLVGAPIVEDADPEIVVKIIREYALKQIPEDLKYRRSVHHNVKPSAEILIGYIVYDLLMQLGHKPKRIMDFEYINQYLVVNSRVIDVIMAWLQNKTYGMSLKDFLKRIGVK